MRLPTIAGGKLRNALLLPVKDGLGEGATSGASGRIGLLGRWTIVSDNGQVWQPYVCAYLWRDWGARATAIFSGVDLVALLEQANRLQLGGGVSVRMTANVSLYANADYQLPSATPTAAGATASAEPLACDLCGEIELRLSLHSLVGYRASLHQVRPPLLAKIQITV